MKALKVLAISLIISLVFLIVINTFVFSWTGLLASTAGLCEYKSVGVNTTNGANKRLGLVYNLAEIYAAMGTNPGYRISNHYNGNGLLISRVFAGVKYNIVLENKEGVSEVNFHTFNFDGYPGGSVADGERCTTPDRYIAKNVNQMIDDLPLDSAHKAELKKQVHVQNTVNGKLF